MEAPEQQAGLPPGFMQGHVNESRRTLPTILVVMMALWSSLFRCSCETVEEHYPTWIDAVYNGAFRRGWIPEYLPASAVEIGLRYNLDTNHIWMAFIFNRRRDIGVFTGNCEPVEEKDVVFPRAIKSMFPWWRFDLTDRETGPRTRYSFYDCTNASKPTTYDFDGLAFAAVEKDTDIVFYWAF